MPPLSAQLLYSRSAYLGTSRCGHRPSPSRGRVGLLCLREWCKGNQFVFHYERRPISGLFQRKLLYRPPFLSRNNDKFVALYWIAFSQHPLLPTEKDFPKMHDRLSLRSVRFGPH